MTHIENDYKIGTYAGGVGAITLLTALTVPVPFPKGVFQPYSDVKMLGNGSFRGIGFPIATWVWDVISPEQRDQLRIFCPAPAVSTLVYIRTRTIDSNDVFDDFLAYMNWKVMEEERDFMRRVQFKIDFTALVAA